MTHFTTIGPSGLRAHRILERLARGAAATLLLLGASTHAQPAPAGQPAAPAHEAPARQPAAHDPLTQPATRLPFVSKNELPIAQPLPHEGKAIASPPPKRAPPIGAPLETRPPTQRVQTPAFAAQTRAPTHKTRSALDVRIVARGLQKPWGLAFLPDGRMLVTEKSGAMRIVTERGEVGAPLAGVPPVLYERDAGLLDVVLDAQFADNRRLYFSFVGFRPEGNALMVASARLSSDQRRLEQLTQLLSLPPFQNATHYGGRLLLHQGLLYVGTSERLSDTARLAAQDPRSPLGKVLRIRTDGGIPPDNPYAKVIGADLTVYSIGHRDVQGFAVEPGTGALWITDHGPQGGDELDLLQPGHNYGWPLVAYGLEYSDQPVNGGRTQWPGTDQPVYYWDPAIAPSGATFYSGSLLAEWRGDLFVAALAGQHLAHLVLRAGQVVAEERLLQEQQQRIRHVAQGPDGALWVLTDDPKDGRVLRIAPRNTASSR